MNRRKFLATTSAVLMLPKVSVANALTPGETPLKWFYVLDGNEHCHPYLAANFEDAIREHVWVSGETYAEYSCNGECHGLTDVSNPCRFCGEDPDAPASHLEACQPKAWADLTSEPTHADWVRAGVNTFCEICDYDEATECTVVDEKAVCLDCYHEMQSEG